MTELKQKPKISLKKRTTKHKAKTQKTPKANKRYGPCRKFISDDRYGLYFGKKSTNKKNSAMHFQITNMP